MTGNIGQSPDQSSGFQSLDASLNPATTSLPKETQHGAAPLSDRQLQDVLTQGLSTSDSMAEAISQFTPFSPSGPGSLKGPIPKMASTPVLAKENKDASTAVPKEKTPPPTYAESYQKSFDANLGQIGDAKNLTDEEWDNLAFLQNNPGVPLDDPKVQAKLQGILDEVNARVQADLASQNIPFETNAAGKLIPPASLQEEYQKEMADTFDMYFEAELGQRVASGEISEGDAAKIRYAHFNPESADPSIKDALGRITDAALQGMRDAGYVVPANYVPPTNSTDFNNALSGQFSLDMEKMIQELGSQQSPPMTTAEMQATVFLFYNPGAGVGNQSILDQAKSLVMGEIGPKFGVPGSSSVEPNAIDFASRTDWNFKFLFQKNLKSLSLTSEQQAQLKAFSANPGVSLDPELKAILNKAWEQTVGQIREANGFPVSWNPGIDLSSALDYDATMSLAAQMEEMVEGMNFAIANMPEGELKNNYISAMLLISNALGTLKDTISKTQSVQSELGLEASKQQLDKQLNAVRAQEEMRAEMGDKLKKMGIQQTAAGVAGMIALAAICLIIGVIAVGAFPANIFIGWIGVILIVLAALILVFGSAQLAIENDPNVSPEAKKALSIVNIIIEVIATILMTIVSFGSLTAVKGAITAARSAANAALQAVKAAVKVARSGMNAAVKVAAQALKAGAQVGTKAVTTGTQVAAKGVTTGVNVAGKSSKVLTQLRSVGTRLKDAANYVSKGSQMAADKAGKAGQVARTAGNVINAAGQGTQALLKMDLSIKKAEIALKKGELDAFTEEIEMQVKLTKKFVKLNLDLLKSLGEWLVDVNKQQLQLVSGAQQALAHLTSSK